MAPDGEDKGPRNSLENIRPVSRVFVALKIVPNVAEELSQLARPLQRFAVRPIAKEDLHLTLVPPWNEAVADAIERLRLVVRGHFPFTLKIRHVGYGPDPKRPRLLWAECTASKELMTLRAALMLAFGQTDERLFLPHATLARIRSNGRLVARRCPIDCELALRQEVATVELMRSPSAGEFGYKVLASLPLMTRDLQRP